MRGWGTMGVRAKYEVLWRVLFHNVELEAGKNVTLHDLYSNASLVRERIAALYFDNTYTLFQLFWQMWNSCHK